MDPKARSGCRPPLRTFALLLAALIAAFISLRSPSQALGQSMNHTGADRDGLIEIKSDLERQAFTSLACSCGGCPHEALSSCRCGFADRYRDEVRAMIGQGLSLEQIKAEWVKRYGNESLTVPPNSGGNQFLYVVPLVLIVAAAGVVITALRHFRRREEERSQKVAAAGGAPAPRDDDDYDKKLDDELKQLDHDE